MQGDTFMQQLAARVEQAERVEELAKMDHDDGETDWREGEGCEDGQIKQRSGRRGRGSTQLMWDRLKH